MFYSSSKWNISSKIVFGSLLTIPFPLAVSDQVPLPFPHFKAAVDVTCQQRQAQATQADSNYRHS